MSPHGGPCWVGGWCAAQGSEDGTVKLWHSTTYRLENTLDYRMERVWSLGYVKGSNWWGKGRRGNECVAMQCMGVGL